MKLYNTLTRSIEELIPLEEGKVRIYNCGLTVYSQPHIGNWLGYVYWDVLTRVLRYSGTQVERTQNITDVGHLTSDDDNGEDKMEKGARREGLTAWDVAAKYIAVADTEAAELGLLPPDHLVRATSMIEEQIAFAKVLDEKGYLYEIPSDGMYFDTSKLPDYGKLARLDVEGLEAGARVSVEGKRNITDFAVWKFSPTDTKRDMEWDSPWGTGFPGWHLECSVIAQQTLGDQIDIHTGGIDHIPVHHTNEIAQTEAVTGKPFSRFWLHVNHIKSEGQKMSKSLGNIYTLGDIKAHGYTPDDFRMFALGKHYRTEGNFTWDNLEAAANRLRHWRETAAMHWQNSAEPVSEAPGGLLDRFAEALLHDLNTPQALAVVDEIMHVVEQEGANGKTRRLLDSIIVQLQDCLGLDIAGSDITDEQKTLVAQREQARADKDWPASDEIRGTLQAQGIGLRDTPTGAVWYHVN